MENKSISISNDVLATIITVAANEVEGVCGVTNTVSNGVSQLFKKKNALNGINIEVNEETQEVQVEVLISVKFGYELKPVAEKVQEKIKNAFESMTGLNPTSIVVNVANIVDEAKGE